MKIRFIGREHTFININGNKIKVLENEIIEVEDYKTLLNNGFRLVEEENEENILNKINSLQSEINVKKSELENSIKKIENTLLKEVRNLEDKYYEFEKEKKQEIFVLNGKLEVVKGEEIKEEIKPKRKSKK